MHKRLPPELPRESDVVLRARRRTEDEVSNLTFVQLQGSTPRRDILELLKGDTSGLEAAHLLGLRLSGKVLILHVFVGDVLPFDASEQFNVFFVTLQVSLLALKFDLKRLIMFRVNRFDTARDDMTVVDLGVELVVLLLDDVLLEDDGSQAILKATNGLVFEDFADSSCD